MSGRRARCNFVWWPAVFLVVLPACDTEDTLAEDPPTQSIEQQHDLPIYVNRDLDLLFVIDNSSSMADEQASLANNYLRFANLLGNIEGYPNPHMIGEAYSADTGAIDPEATLCTDTSCPPADPEIPSVFGKHALLFPDTGWDCAVHQGLRSL